MKNKKLFAILTLLCFMFTLMPVAAFAAIDEQQSYAYTADKNVVVDENEKVELTFDLVGAIDEYVYVWFEEVGYENQTVNAVTAEDTVLSAASDGFFRLNQYANTEVSFGRAGTFVLHAAVMPADTAPTEAQLRNDEVRELRTDADYKTIVVESDSVSTSKYETTISVDGTVVATDLADGGKVTGAVAVDANSIDKAEIKVVVENGDDEKVKNAEVEIATSSDSIEVSDAKLSTGTKGYVEFDVTGSVEGTYYVYVTVGSYEARIEVVVGAFNAAYIETVKQPAGAIDLDITDLSGRVEFEITDINGNVVVANAGAAEANANGDYVKFVQKPAKSDLKNKDLKLVHRGEQYGWTLTVNGGLDAEGTYEFKVLLDNGKAAYATVEVKEFQKPVSLLLTYEQEAVELGAVAVLDNLLFVDANGVTKSAAKDVVLAANGYAVAEFDEDGTSLKYQDAQGQDVFYGKGAVKVKADEKYVGSTINVIAVSERYDLTATATIKVTADATELKFVNDNAEVDINNKIDIQLVDGAGTKVAPTNMTKAEINYIVLDKPADAKVNVNTASQKDLKDKGLFTMALTSNKVGNVTVQAIAKLTDAAGVTKYYTGTEIIAVGTADKGDVVVMSINSNEIVINDATAEIDAAPIVENNRTFVPFRALAEAFGATVAYDEATQAVTAELNGVTVVMTIGSATYTVNGETATMDVAPFINGSRTMVPVRFAAEAFGIKVIPTYDENGATADILFNL